jgi:hypothetical protein
MKALAKSVMVLIALGFCLPSYGEILVYKCTQTATWCEQQLGQWAVEKETWRGYVVIDVNYDDNTITQAELIWYGKDEDGKWFEQQSSDLELVRVNYDSKVQWVVMEKEVQLDGEELVGGKFAMVAGSARSRNIGTGENREVATTLSGYVLTDQTEDGGRYIEMSKMTVTLYPSWTYWANGDDMDEGKQNFGLTTAMIKAYLIKKGYIQE